MLENVYKAISQVSQVNTVSYKCNDFTILCKMIIGTTVVFVSFSISALLAERGRWLYLGGTLMSMLNIMILFSFANLFLRSTFIYQAHLYLGLFVICGFVIYDTQLIIEKHHMGSRDFIMHSLDLFIDFVGVFRHLLVILTQKVIIQINSSTVNQFFLLISFSHAIFVSVQKNCIKYIIFKQTKLCEKRSLITINALSTLIFQDLCPYGLKKCIS